MAAPFSTLVLTMGAKPEKTAAKWLAPFTSSQMGGTHALRMPLHTKQRGGRMDKRFHRTVRSMGNSGQIVCNSFHDLVVIAVDRCGRADLFGKPAGNIGGYGSSWRDR